MRHGPRTERIELGDGLVKYKYADGTTVYRQLKPKAQRRKYEKRPPKPPRLITMLAEEDRKMPMTHPFRDVYRRYKGQHKTR